MRPRFILALSHGTKISLQNHEEIEFSLLAGILAEPGAFEDVLDIVQEGHFASDLAATAFEAIKNLYMAQKPIDMAHIQDIVGANKAQLIDLISAAPAPRSTKAHAVLVLKNYKRRNLAKHLLSASQAAENGSDPAKITNFLDQLIADTCENVKTDFYTSKALSDRVIQEMREEKRNPGLKKSVSTGYEDIDQLLAGGVRPGELAIVAGRPAMGKTALAVNFAANMAKNGNPCLIFSLEMTADSLQRRIAQLVCGVSRDDLDPANLGSLEKAEDALNRIADLPIAINDTSALGILSMRRITQRAVRQLGVKVVFVDYLQLARGPNPTDMREREIAEISAGLKSIAKDFNVAVIAASQLNRNVEMREDKRPMMSDLRESGAIEQDADIVMLLYRDDYYNPNPTAQTGDTEVIIGKHRNGPTGTVHLSYISSLTRFSSPLTSFSAPRGGLVF